MLQRLLQHIYCSLVALSSSGCLSPEPLNSKAACPREPFSLLMISPWKWLNIFYMQMCNVCITLDVQSIPKRENAFFCRVIRFGRSQYLSVRKFLFLRAENFWFYLRGKKLTCLNFFFPNIGFTSCFSFSTTGLRPKQVQLRTKKNVWLHWEVRWKPGRNNDGKSPFF